MDLFLLSPANTRGRRADGWQQAAFENDVARGIALRLREQELTFAELFCATSALYFRGKLEYAERFAERHDALVIAPGIGLVPPHFRVTGRRWQALRSTTTSASDAGFVRPLERAVKRLLRQRQPQRVVFLGSVDPLRYLGVLEPLLGERLVVPQAFLGIGSLQRGSLLRKRARSGRALAYVSAQRALRSALVKT